MPRILVGELVRLSDTVEGVITNVIENEDGEPVRVIVREGSSRWHDISVRDLEPRKFDA